jgi:hypothetical protein
MMQCMVEDRGGRLCAMDDRYCVDNGAMIAQVLMMMMKMMMMLVMMMMMIMMMMMVLEQHHVYRGNSGYGCSHVVRLLVCSACHFIVFYRV